MNIPAGVAVAGALWLLSAATSHAQLVDVGGFGGDEPIAISADSLEVDADSRNVTFTGSVEVSQGELEVHADRMIVRYAEETDSGESRVEEIEAISNVSVSIPTGTARGDSGIWTVTTGIVTLQDNVSLANDNGVLTGEVAQLDLGSGVIRVTGGDGRVNVLLDALRDE